MLLLSTCLGTMLMCTGTADTAYHCMGTFASVFQELILTRVYRPFPGALRDMDWAAAGVGMEQKVGVPLNQLAPTSYLDGSCTCSSLYLLLLHCFFTLFVFLGELLLHLPQSMTDARCCCEAAAFSHSRP